RGVVQWRYTVNPANSRPRTTKSRISPPGAPADPDAAASGLDESGPGGREPGRHVAALVARRELPHVLLSTRRTRTWRGPTSTRRSRRPREERGRFVNRGLTG